MNGLERLAKRFLGRGAQGPLDAEGRLRTDLWIDRPDAHDVISRKLAAGEIDEAQAANLRRLVDDGYFVFSPRIDDGIYDEIGGAVERLWTERSSTRVAYGYRSLLRRFADADAEHRKPSCRIADLHEGDGCAAARSLYFHPEIFRYMELMLGEPAVATQSLYFEWGSQQPLHRDPVYVQMTPPSHLLAAWIALEDIGPDCGPLLYVPGSHRMPYYQFAPGRFTFDMSRDGDAEREAGEAFDRANCQAAGLEATPLLCRRGDVLIWHHSLLHGGSVPADPAQTRKSFVVHFSSRRTMRQVHNSYLEPGSDTDFQHFVSRTVVEDNGCAGFSSPLVAGEPTD